MNVNDFTAPECPPNFVGIVTSVFMRQAQLIEKYREIEQLPRPPISIHTSNGQRVVKDFFWRTTEEMCEGYEAMMFKHRDDPDVARIHAMEEMADATHFFVEALIYAGFGAEEVSRWLMIYPSSGRGDDREFRDAMFDAIYDMGIASNFLKNRPWKQSQVPTDLPRFRDAVKSAWLGHVVAWSILGDEKDMFNFYFKKADVNAFRQRSKY